jgi:sirohydrochlorin cobaltochelatase
MIGGQPGETGPDAIAGPNDRAVVLLGHGSRDPEGAAEFLTVARAVRAALPGVPVEAGVLEFAGPVAPSIGEAFARGVARGARRVLALPVLLHFAGHATADMPHETAAAQRRFPAVEMRLAQPLTGHPALLDVLADRCAATPLGAERDTTVLLVGRGSTSARANADLYASARLFEERGTFAGVEVCFVSLADPCVVAGLRRCVALGARRVIVAPYFINTGLLVRRIASQIEAARLFYPETEISIAAHFGPDPRLVAALLDRAREAWPEVVGAAEAGGHAANGSSVGPGSIRAQPMSALGGAR